MVSYLHKGNRSQLSPEQRDFLAKLIPATRLISSWIKDKYLLFRKKFTPSILPSVVTVDIIVESLWGSHPLAQTHFEKRYSNNLANLETNDFWEGRTTTFNGLKYKCFSDWLHFSTDYSDTLVFSKLYDDLLDKPLGAEDQIRILGRYKPDSQIYIPKAQAIWSYYDLGELDG